MQIVKLLLFLSILFLKNLKSAGSIFLEGFGFQTAVVILIVLNVGVVTALLWSFQEEQKLKKELLAAEAHLTQQQQFWQKLSHQFPGHKEIEQAEKVLK